MENGVEGLAKRDVPVTIWITEAESNRMVAVAAQFVVQDAILAPRRAVVAYLCFRSGLNALERKSESKLFPLPTKLPEGKSGRLKQPLRKTPAR